jgi:hypothetical protein
VKNSGNLFERRYVMISTIIFVLGVLAGIAIAKSTFDKYTAGSLIINTSDSDDGPYLFLDLDEDINSISKHKSVTFKILVKNLPQK